MWWSRPGRAGCICGSMTTADIHPGLPAANSPRSARTCGCRPWPRRSTSRSRPASNIPTRSIPGRSACWRSTCDSGAAQVLDSSSGSVNWTVPAGNWEIVLARSQFRSGPTRSANNKTGAKDGTHSLMDYLNPEADKLFIQWQFDAYKQAVGDEMGKTVLGFRGDEPAFGFNPWSPVLLAEFQKRKGYDLRPYLGTIASINIGRAPRPPGWRRACRRRCWAGYRACRACNRRP